MRYRYARPEVRRAICAQYVLGTLRGQARARLEHLLPGDAALRAELRWWEQHFGLLALKLPPVAPRQVVWLDLQQRVQSLGAVDLPAPAPRRAVQTWAWLATAASLVLATTLFINARTPTVPQVVVQNVPVPAPPMYVAMLHPEQQSSAWMVTVTPSSGRMKLKVLHEYPTDAQHDCELWVIAGGKPVSVGVMPRSGELTLSWPKDVPFAENLVLAVSMEPAGGSPTGSPTGPVLATGEIHQAG